MKYKLFSIICMCAFYTIYLYKLVSLNKKSIKTNQAGKGNKEKKVIVTEKVMSFSNLLVILAMLLSIVLLNPSNNTIIIVVSLLCSLLSILLFLLATITMKDSWRVGIPLEKTNIVTNGIYKWSRNPAFVGFDLLYISNTLLYFNIPLLFSSIFAIVMLHIQIFQEEKFMLKTFNNEYKKYKKQTLRYFGRRRK